MNRHLASNSHPGRVGEGQTVIAHVRAHAHVHIRENPPTLPDPPRRQSRCLVPFDRREGLTTAEAAERADRTERTIRMWCRDHDLGRHVAGGPWLVSKIALAMFLNDDADALRAYLTGDRHHPRVVEYFTAEGLGDLVERWRTRVA